MRKFMYSMFIRRTILFYVFILGATDLTCVDTTMIAFVHDYLIDLYMPHRREIHCTEKAS